MKHILSILSLFFLLAACSNETASTSEKNTANNLEVDSSTSKTAAPNTTETNSLATKTNSPLEDYVGVYTKSGHDNAWLVKLLFVQDRLEATLFEFEGMLPPPADFTADATTTDNAMITSLVLDVDLTTQTFTSELGTGQLDGNQIVFDHQKDLLGDPLRLERNDAFKIE
ncbi:hypothetical protein [Aureispira sp. CCB-E]|uniref:hypothetical protein n=1 Tax=Aureispira sp. CCB-E TaxID=3051121 RepID=UPI0028690B50|nr:hypothetical protein [Aureispira sp. CCB-E]WMX16211.1 hypothetical protein QP953_07520 [Aureispira sp. CCB-E]